jgi:fructokinase
MVVFEPSSIGEPRLFQEALALAHILKYSHERVGQLREVESAVGSWRHCVGAGSAARRDLPLLEIETLSEEGLRYRSKLLSCASHGWERLHAYTVDHVKDAAGAGDWCTAGIIHRLGQKGLQGLQHVTSVQLLDALCFGQALAAWNCGFEGARGGMYSVDKETFRCDIEQIMSGKGRAAEPPSAHAVAEGPKRPRSYNSNSAVKGVLGSICPTCGNKRVR